MGKGTLGDLIKSGRIVHEPTIWYWLSQALAGLSALADNQMVHCDIKPASLFLDDDYNLKIGDFGFLAVCKPEATIVQFGTPEFQPPEVYSGGHIGPQIDVWALAVSFISLITSQYPWPQDKRHKPMDQRRKETKEGHRIMFANGRSRFSLSKVAQFVPSHSLQHLLCEVMMQPNPANRLRAAELPQLPEFL